MKKAVFLRSDFIVGLFLLAFGGVAIIGALGISAGPSMRTIPPNTIPLICSIGICLCGLALSIRAFMVEQPAFRFPVDLRQGIVLVLFLTFFGLFEKIDYRLSVPVFVFAVMFALGCRSRLQLIVVPVGTILGIWVFFQKLFDVYLPSWT